MASADASLLRGTIRLTPGRIERCARQIKSRLRPDEAATLGPIADDAEAAGRLAFRLFETREKSKGAAYSELAKDANTSMDDATIGVHGFLDALLRVYPAGTENGDRVRRLYAAFFPRTLRHATNSPYDEEISAVRSILELAKGDRAADVAATPGLAALVEELATRAAHFEAVMEREDSKAPSHVEAASAALDAEECMVDLVNAIQVLYRGKSPSAVERRTELLAPYVFQQKNLRERYRRRPKSVEIDPVTGDDLESSETPADPAASDDPKKDPVPA